MPKWLAILCSLFVIIAFTRVLFDTGAFRLMPVVELFQDFDLNFDDIFLSFEEFKDIIFEGTIWWNDDLIGFSGFVQNIRNVVFSFFTIVVNVFIGSIRVSVDSVRAVVDFVLYLVRFVRTLFGF